MEIKRDRIKQTLETIFENIEKIIDVDKVMGKPITTPDNTFVVPVSKVTIGMLVGGGEYGKTKLFKDADDLPYSAGNGAVISIKPCCFLVKECDKYKLLSVKENSCEKIIDLTADIIGGIVNGGEDD